MSKHFFDFHAIILHLYVCPSESAGGKDVDPAMIGVLVGLALMFVIICVVLRLFSK